MDDKKKLILAIALFVVAAALIVWYVGFSGADPGAAVGGTENSTGASGPAPNRFAPAPRNRR